MPLAARVPLDVAAHGIAETIARETFGTNQRRDRPQRVTHLVRH
jgi:hypothetical protein